MTGECEQSQIHTHMYEKYLRKWMVYDILLIHNASSGCSAGVFIALPLVIPGW